MLFDETKKPHGFKGREAFSTFKVNYILSQVRLNRYQKNAGLINFSVLSLKSASYKAALLCFYSFALITLAINMNSERM
jgi:hypothetical protein